MSDSVRPHRRQPTRLPCPWDSLGKNTGVGCHFLLQCMKVKESEKVGFKLNIQKMKIMASSPITSWQIDWETVADFIFWGSKITADGDYSHEIKTLAPWKISCDQPSWKKGNDQPRQHIKKRRHYFANEGPSSQGCGFSSSHVWMLELDYKES